MVDIVANILALARPTSPTTDLNPMNNLPMDNLPNLRAEEVLTAVKK